MRDANRIPEILDALQKLWMANPDLRLGQLLVNVVNLKDPSDELFYIEDDELHNRLLVSGITADNQHDQSETDFGKPVGREIL